MDKSASWLNLGSESTEYAVDIVLEMQDLKDLLRRSCFGELTTQEFGYEVFCLLEKKAEAYLEDQKAIARDPSRKWQD